MFIYNMKLSKDKIFKTFFIIISILMLIIFIISIYKIFTKASDSNFKVNDSIQKDKVITLTANNYTNILKAVHENLDNYVGIKIQFTGYVYRLLDFSDNEFVLARNMIISSNNQTVVVGFLCNYDKAKDIPNNTWVNITGIISKGNYHGEIPIIKITNINKADTPNDEFVYPPDNTYIQTNALL